MAKYKVETDNGTYVIETEDPPSVGQTLLQEAVVNPAKQVAAGAVGASATANRMTANIADKLDWAADQISNITGLPKGGLFRNISDWARGQQHQQEQQAAQLSGGRTDLASQLYRGGTQGVMELPTYAVASHVLGPTAGMAAVGAIRESDRGWPTALQAAAEGALMGKALEVMGPASRPVRLTGAGAMAYATARLNGADNTTALANAATMAGMAGVPAGGVSARDIFEPVIPEKIPITPRLLRPANPKVTAALDYLEQQGAEVPAAARTENVFVKNIQKLADVTPAGAIIAGKSAKTNTAVLEQTAANLIDRATPEIPADTLYSQFRAAEADPANIQTVTTGSRITPEAKAALDAESLRQFGRGYSRGPGGLDPAQAAAVEGAVKQTGVDLTPQPVTEDIPLPVDVTALKQQIKPIYDRISRVWEPARRNASPGYTAMKSILDGPNVVSASLAEEGLSGLKAMAREGDSRSAGIGKFIVPKLQGLIDDAAAQGGPDIVGSLQQGRKAAAQEIAVDTLNKIFAKAQAEGGFHREAGIWQDWLRKKDEIANQLPPDLVSDLDKFFLGAKKLAENPNPSGSATAGTSGAMLTGAILHPMTGVPAIAAGGAVSKIMHSPAGVRALREGISIPLRRPGVMSSPSNIPAEAAAQFAEQRTASSTPTGGLSTPPAVGDPVQWTVKGGEVRTGTVKSHGQAGWAVPEGYIEVETPGGRSQLVRADAVQPVSETPPATGGAAAAVPTKDLKTPADAEQVFERLRETKRKAKGK